MLSAKRVPASLLLLLGFLAATAGTQEVGTPTVSPSVTDGTVVDPKTIEPITPWSGKEIRGAAIEGGETHHLSKGDVVIAPNGVPHRFKELAGPFVYYVVSLR
jgi:hypothetical protein